jgi:DNA-binding response OmpR family regulator
MTGKPVVWVIDSQQWPRAYLRAELDEHGFETVGYAQLSEAVADLRLRAPRPEAIVVELHDQYLEAILLEGLTGSGIPVVLLTGSMERDEGTTKGYGWAAVMKRPFTIGAVVEMVQEITGSHSNGP